MTIIDEARDLWNKIEPFCVVQVLEDVIIPFYSDPRRTYHNLNHIVNCLKLIDLYTLTVGERRILATALWFHDVIYIPGGSINESNSANIAEISMLASKVIAENQGFCKISGEINKVKQLILSTKHDKKETNHFNQIICDIDLAILGGTEEEFSKYDMDIRQEYKEVPLEQYKAVRSMILKRFLDRPFIYYTYEMRALTHDGDPLYSGIRGREERARYNLSNWILGDENDKRKNEPKIF